MRGQLSSPRQPLAAPVLTEEVTFTTSFPSFSSPTPTPGLPFRQPTFL